MASARPPILSTLGNMSPGSVKLRAQHHREKNMLRLLEGSATRQRLGPHLEENATR